MSCRTAGSGGPGLACSAMPPLLLARSGQGAVAPRILVPAGRNGRRAVARARFKLVEAIDRYGHTPISPEEAIPWSADLLISGTGVSGQLPVMPELYEEAHRRGVEIVAE